MHLYEVQTASCPFSAAIEFAATFFRASSKTPPANCAREPSWWLPACQVIVDYTDPTRRHHALKLRWTQRAFLLSPGFEGFLSVRPTHGQSQLTFEGIFRSDLSLPDDMPQAEDDPTIVRGSMRALLRRIVAHVEAEWLQFVNDCPRVSPSERLLPRERKVSLGL